MMNSFRKKHGEVKPILKDKEKEDKGLALQLVPEYIDKKAFKQGNHNPNYVFAGALYIPKDIIQIVNANDTGAAQIQMGPIKDGENDNSSDDQSVAIEDPDVRKYIVRILRYFKYDPEEAMATLREASFKIKNRARGIVKRTYSQNTVTKLQAWRAKVQYNEGESEDDLFNPSHSVFTPKAPSTEEGGKEDCFYGDDNEEVNKQSFIQKTFTKLFPTKSSSKIDKSHLTFQEISSSDTPYSSEGERSSRKNRWKSMSKSMSQLINEGNKQVTGFLSSVTTDPEEKNENFKKITIFNFNKIICNKIKKVVIMLKTIYQQKRNVHNKAAKNPTNFIYSEMYLNYQGPSVKKSSSKYNLPLSKQDELLLNYLTAPRIHHCDTYTVMLLRNDNSQNVRSHNRKRALKKMKKRLQRLDNLPHQHLEIDQCNNLCSKFDKMGRNSNVIRFNKVIPKQEESVCFQPLQSYNALDNRMDHRNREEVMRQSVDIVADTFVNIVDSPSDPKCKVEITGHGYKGKFNVGLDPIIDEVLYNSLQNLKETYENTRDYFPTLDRRQGHTLSNIADNVRNYLKSKVTGRNSMRNSISDRFSSENVIGRTSIHRLGKGSYIEYTPRITFRDRNTKHPRYRQNRKRSCPLLGKIPRNSINNENYRCKPEYLKSNNDYGPKKKKNILSSESESFEDRQYVRSSKDPRSPDLDSSIFGETSSTLDESIRLFSRGALAANVANKKKPIKTREIHKQSYYPDLSYISEKDWKAATEILINEREGSIMSLERSDPVRYKSLNKNEHERTDKQGLQNNQSGNNKVIKMKETMTTTVNGVTTLTQTEVIKAVNQSSQCIIPSASKDVLVGTRELNIMPMKQNKTKREESSGRLAKDTYSRHRNLFEEVNVPYKNGINEVVSHRNEKYSPNIGYSQNLYPRSYEDLYEKHLNSTISIEKLSNQGRNKSHGYNDISMAHNTDHHCQEHSKKDHWSKEHCHSNPSTVNTYLLPREMSLMTPHAEINGCERNIHEGHRRKVQSLHKVHSDSTVTCHKKPNSRNPSNVVDDKTHIKINALTEIERENTPFKRKQNLQHRIPLEISEQQESQTPEEVIVTGNGKAKIHVSLRPCDTTQRQQAFLELMEELKSRLESENKLLTNNSSFHTMAFHDMNECTPLQSFQPMRENPLLTSINKRKSEKGTFADMKKTPTMIMRSSTDERRDNRMRIRYGPLTSYEIDAVKRNYISVCCKKPCLCDEKRKGVDKATSVVIPRKSTLSKTLSLNQEDITKQSGIDKATSVDIPRKSRLSKTLSLNQEDITKENGIDKATSIFIPRNTSVSKTLSLNHDEDITKQNVIDKGTSVSTSITRKTILSKILSLNQENNTKPEDKPKSTSMSVQTDDLLVEVQKTKDNRKFVSVSNQTDDLPRTSSTKSSSTKSSIFPERKTKSIDRETSKFFPRISRLSKSLSLNQEDITKPEDEPSASIAIQTEDFVDFQGKPEVVTISSQTDNLTLISSPKSSTNKSFIASDKKGNPSRWMRKSSRTNESKESRPRLKTGSLFLKSFTKKKSIKESHLRRSQSISSEEPLAEINESNIPKGKQYSKSLNKKNSLNKNRLRQSQSISSEEFSEVSEESNLPKGSQVSKLMNKKNSLNKSRLRQSQSILSEDYPEVSEESNLRKGSQVSKLMTEINSPRLRRSSTISSEELAEEEKLSNIRKPKNKKKSKKSSLPKTKNKEPTRKSSKRSSVLTSRGSLFVRRSSAPPASREPTPRQPSVINQRVWIQNLSIPRKYPDQIATNVTKKKISKPSDKTYLLQNLKEVSKIYSSSESDNYIVNSNPDRALHKRISNNTFSKINRNFFSIPHESENVSSSQENDQTSIVYSSPKQSKGEKFTVAPKRQIINKPGIYDSISFCSNRKSSSFVDIITDKNSVHNISSKFASDTSIINSRSSTDSTPSIISKYVKRSVISSDTPEKSNCSLLSYEESPTLIEYVENLQNSPSGSLTTSDNSINSSTANKVFKCAFISSKSQLDRKSVSTLNETESYNKILSGDSLKCFSETNEDIERVPCLSKTKEDHFMNSLPDRMSGEANLPTATGSKSFRENKSTSSGSSDSRTTVISGPIVYRKRLGMRLQNFITKRSGALDPLRLNKIIYLSRRKGSSKESAIVAEKNKSLKSRFRRFNSRSFLKRIQPGHSRVKNLPVFQRISPDDTELSDDSDSVQDYKQTDKYTKKPSTRQKSTERLKKDSTVSAIVVKAVLDTMTTKRCITETVKMKKHEKKAQRESKSSQLCNLNSTLCINDDCVRSADAECFGEANCTTIGFDSSNASLKKDKSKIAKCYEVKTLDQTIYSSTAWIENSSDSDLETNATRTEYIHKCSKISGQNENKCNNKYVMMTTDLRQSSSELLTKKKSPRKTFIHRKHTFISNVKQVGTLSSRYHGKKEVQPRTGPTIDCPSD